MSPEDPFSTTGPQGSHWPMGFERRPPPPCPRGGAPGGSTRQGLVEVLAPDSGGDEVEPHEAGDTVDLAHPHWEGAPVKAPLPPVQLSSRPLLGSRCLGTGSRLPLPLQVFGEAEPRD